jgi:uncharacterized protein YdaT
MPWSTENYPISMKNMKPEIRAKAIEIANRVLEQDGDDAKAIRIGISRAKAWSRRHASKPTSKYRAKQKKE